MEFKSKVVEYGSKSASQFKLNPSNWRTHSAMQRKTIAALLGEVGWVQGVIVNKTTGNLIDGHARVEEALKANPDSLVPYVEVELTPDEELKVLLTFDPVATLAESDREALKNLSEKVKSENDFVAAAMFRLFAENGVLSSFYEPALTPVSAEGEVTTEDLQKEEERIYEQFHKQPTMTELQCPHCSHEFFIG